jgi:lipoate-protein ligase A
MNYRILITPPARGAWNMAVDESILEHIQRGEAKPTLRLYAWNPPCLSLGHAQPFKDVDVARLKQRGWEVVRRVTGGRAILHTDELTYSIIGKEQEPVLAGGVLESYNRIAQALLKAVYDLGLPVEMKVGRVENNIEPNPVCFEVPSTYEITVHDKKLIGSAQARKKGGVLQHGSLPLYGDLTRICDALFFQDEAARAKAKQSLLAHATTVESVLGKKKDWSAAASAFAGAFEAELGILFVREEMSKPEIARTDELIKEKYDHPAWLERI